MHYMSIEASSTEYLKIDRVLRQVVQVFDYDLLHIFEFHDIKDTLGTVLGLIDQESLFKMRKTIFSPKILLDDNQNLG